MLTIGTCSKCNGPVQMPDLWGGTVPPVPTCAHCGATAKDPYGPTIPMEERSPSRTGAQQPLAVTVLPDITQLQRYKIEPMLTNNNWFTRAYRRDDGRWVEWHDVEEMFLRAKRAQQPAAGDGEVDCWCIDCGGDQPGHDPTCSYMHGLHGEQPAAVDGAVVERIAALLNEEATGEPWTVDGVEHFGPDRDYYRGLARKVAALAAQHREESK